MIIPLKISENNTKIGLSISGAANNVAAEINDKIEVVGGDPYRGEYIITPADIEQRLETANRFCEQDIIISAIPQNYGLITWDGSVLTVS